MARPLSLPAALKRIRVSSPFGPRKNPNNPNHIGCDWATPVGLPLECTLDEGTVVLVGGSNTHGWGYHVHIQCLCPFKHQVEYHILRDDPRKRWKVGDRVRFGDVIGHTGRSGSLAGKRYDPHHHHGTSELNARGKRVYLDPLHIGWPDVAGLQSKPFEEDDMYTDEDRATLKAVYDWIRGDNPEAGTTIARTLKDTAEIAQGIRDLNVPDTRNRIGNIQYALGLVLERNGKAAEFVAEFDDADLAAIAKTVNDERDRRERERLGK